MPTRAVVGLAVPEQVGATIRGWEVEGRHRLGALELLANLTDDGYEGSIFRDPSAVGDMLPIWNVAGDAIYFMRRERDDDRLGRAR